MEGKKMVMLFVAVIVLCLISSMLSASQMDAITCDEAIPLMLPCQPFLVGFASISPACCSGANVVFQRADTTQDSMIDDLTVCGPKKHEELLYR
ncbi:hypothetical protein RJT34_00108 [Clitoria ternatea]|uniref:Bifunctional inhibitor/plant lipid transfer protein/seed storage helical domain-containing protein n=1 Tax=Clitoria ternatea TaxID=43366 RepID=A0AAN9KIV1_CLITE